MPEQDLLLRSRQVSIIFAKYILQLARIIHSETKSLIPKGESMCLGMRHGYQWEIATSAILSKQCDVGRKSYMNSSCRYSHLSAILFNEHLWTEKAYLCCGDVISVSPNCHCISFLILEVQFYDSFASHLIS